MNNQLTTETPETRTINQVGNTTDLAVIANVTPPAANLRDQLTYNYTITNNGPSQATDVTFRDALPFKVTVDDITASQGTTEGTNNIVRANLGTIDVGQSATVTITRTAVVAGALDSEITLTSNETDPNPNNDTFTQQVFVNPVFPEPVDLELTKTADNPTPQVGDQITFTLTLTNNGPGVAGNIQVTDLLPSGLTYISDLPEQGQYDPNTGIWDVGNMRDNLERTLNITAQVSAVGPLTNNAEVTRIDELDSDSTPNNNNPDEDDQASFTINGSGTSPGGGGVVPINTPTLNTVSIATPAPNNLGTPQNTFSNGFYYLTENDDTAIPPAFAETPIIALSGNDNLAGTEGANYINGDRGSDTLNGLGGNDTLFGGEASDVIDGGTGDDQIWGSTDNDRLNGGDGNDTLQGGSENDILTGDFGSDWLWGDSGQDILTGGADNDIFVIATDGTVPTPLELADVIADFQPGADVIGLADNLLLSQLTFEPVNLQIDGGSPVASTAIKLDSDYLAIVQGVVDANVFATNANFATV